jgi:hypothetical protein
VPEASDEYVEGPVFCLTLNTYYVIRIMVAHAKGLPVPVSRLIDVQVSA